MNRMMYQTHACIKPEYSSSILLFGRNMLVLFVFRYSIQFRIYTARALYNIIQVTF